MRIVVCLKPVPDPKQWAKLALDPQTRTLVRTGIDMTINPLDKNALEAALVIRESLGGEVTVLSMAPPEAGPVLREALAMGADRAVLLSDRLFAGSDTLGTAHVLAQGIKALGGAEVVLCGDETIDGGTAQVSAQVAEFLGLPNIMHVDRIEPREEGPWRVRALIEQGAVTVEVAPPLVLSVVKSLNTPRYVTLMNVLEAEDKELTTWSAGDICLSEACVGLADSPTQMADLLRPRGGQRAEMLSGEPREQAVELAQRLKRLGFC